jgi:hypothetical protein
MPSLGGHRSLKLAAALACLSLSLACSARPPGSTASLTPRPPSTPSPTMAGSTTRVPVVSGHIIFSRAGGTFGDETIFAGLPNGTHIRRISGVGSTCCARISQDAKTVLESAASPDQRGTTALTNADGSHRRLLPIPAGTINLVGSAWSPDGSHIAADGWDDTHPHRNGLYLERRDGTHIIRLTKAIPGGHDIPADFAPGGDNIAFIRTAPNASLPVGGIYIVDVRTKRVRRVDVGSRQAAYTVRWAPSGRWLAFSPYWDAPSKPLLLVHPNGSGLHRIYLDKGSRSVVTPTWSPNGRALMFGLAAATGDDHPNDDLVVLGLRNHQLTPIVATHDFKRLPDWVG